MRLLPRRRRDRTRDARPSLDPPTGQKAAGAQRAAGPAHWRRLTPLAPTVRRPPLTFAATMGVFADEKSRPLIHGPGRASRPTARQDDAPESATDAGAAREERAVEPAAGRVTGLVVVRAEAPEPEPPAPPPPPARKHPPTIERTAAAEPAPARLVPRVLPSAGPRPSLVKAADEYVGAPEADAAPYVSSAWLRMLESYRPPWASGGAAAPSGGAVAPPPIPAGGGSWSSEAPVAPPRTPRTAHPDAPRPARRASLAESRRLGLGSPLRQEPSQSPDPQEEGGQGTQTVRESAADDATTGPDLPAEGGERSARLVHPQAPAVAPVSTPDAAAQPAAAPDADRDEGGSARPAPESPVRPARSEPPAPPRLGLAAPIERPIRRTRRTAPDSRPAAPRLPLPPTQGVLQPPPQAADDAAQETAAETAGGVEDQQPTLLHPAPPQPTPKPTAPHPTTPHPTTPQRAVPVYRFVPGQSPQSAAALPRRTAPAPAPPAPAPAAQPPGPTAAPSLSARPLTHPPARPRSDDARAEAGPQAPAQPAGPTRAQRPASVRLPEPAPTFDPLRRQRPQQPDAVPHELLDAVRRAQGIDVSDVPIRRGPEVAEEARALGARSFTRGAEVFLPEHEGPADQPVARGLLAHELTHAAQQRVLGTGLPAEDSDAGRALEAQAVAAERWARGMSGSPAPGGGAAIGSASSWTAPWHTAPTAGVQRQADDVMSDAEPEAPAPTPSDASSSDAQAPQAGSGDEEMGAARDKLLELSRRHPVDLDDPADLEELSSRIYQRIQQKLRRELVVDRERAGRLGETGPFGPAR